MRGSRIEKNVLKKGSWSAEEDKKLIDYITRYGHWNWQLLPKFAGLERCGKSCRLRWLNYLRPNLKRGNYTQQEEEIIIKLHQDCGSRCKLKIVLYNENYDLKVTRIWSAIAAYLPGRTDNDIKNHWHTNLKNRSQQDSVTKPQPSNSKHQSPTANPFQSIHTTQDSCLFSSHSSSSTCTDCSTVTSVGSKENLVLHDGFDFSDAEKDLISGNFELEPYVLDSSYISTEPECFGPVFDAELWSYDETMQEYCSPFPQHYSFSSTSIDDTNLTTKENLIPGDEFAFCDADTDLMSENFLLEPYMLDISSYDSVFDAELWSYDKTTQEYPSAIFQHPLSSTITDIDLMSENFSLGPYMLDISSNDTIFDAELWSYGKTRQEYSSPILHHAFSSTNTEYTTFITKENQVVPEEYTTDTFTNKENLVLQNKFAFCDADMDPMSGNFWLEQYMIDISNLHIEFENFDPELWIYDNNMQDFFPFS